MYYEKIQILRVNTFGVLEQHETFNILNKIFT